MQYIKTACQHYHQQLSFPDLPVRAARDVTWMKALKQYKLDLPAGLKCIVTVKIDRLNPASLGRPPPRAPSPGPVTDPDQAGECVGGGVRSGAAGPLDCRVAVAILRVHLPVPWSPWQMVTRSHGDRRTRIT